MAHTLLNSSHERFLMNCLASISEEREQAIFAHAQGAAAKKRMACARALRTRLHVRQGWDLEVSAEDEQDLQTVLMVQDGPELLMRARTDTMHQSPLHVYGGVLHVLLYPVTLVLAVLFAFFEGVCMVRRDVARDFARKTDVPSFSFFGEAFFVFFMFVVFSLISPFCIIPVILSSPLDILLLLLRPCFSPKVRQAVVVFFFPSSLVFTVGATLGIPVFVHCFLGGLPSAATNASTHLSYERRHYRTVLTTLRLCPDLDISNCHRSRTAMARTAVKHVYGITQEVPGAVVWAFVLQDTKLCRAWVAGIGAPDVSTPDVLHAWPEPDTGVALPRLFPWDRFCVWLLGFTDLAAMGTAVASRRKERGQLPPELREQVEKALAFQGPDLSSLFQGDYPDGVAEATVTRRTRRRVMQQHPLHVFGGVLHVALYPVTFFMALADVLGQVWSDTSDRMRQGLREEKVPSYECLFNGLCASFYGLIVVVPMCICFFCLWVVFAVPYDILTLLIRPCLSTRRVQTLVHCALPTSLAFCFGARHGISVVNFVHRFLGAIPSKYSISASSKASEVAAAFRLAPNCRRGDILQGYADTPDSLAMSAAADLFPLYRKPLQARVDCAALLAWALILGDQELLRMWEASAEKVVEVTVLRMSGEVLWGPRSVPSFLTISELKKQIKDEALAGEGNRKRVRLLLSTPDTQEEGVPRELSRDTETLLEFAHVGSLNLLLVLEQVEAEPRAYWGEAGFGMGPPAPPLIGDEDDDDDDYSLSSGATPRVPPTPLAYDALLRPGSDSNWVREQLTEVQRIYPSNQAFAAVKENGAVVSWGSRHAGGDCSAVREQLEEGVQAIFSTDVAYAALKLDGSVVTWGSEFAGGDSSEVRRQLSSGVQNIYNTCSAFAALKEDGAVVTWGDPVCGGDDSDVENQIDANVMSVAATSTAFAALKADGSVVTWGHEQGGGDCSGVQTLLAEGVKHIYGNMYAFAAVKNDGTVVTW